jgi:hypothetical protein
VTVAALLLVILLLAVALVVTVVRAHGSAEPGQPDHTTDDVVSRLLDEVRKWQAEAAHWKATAERLQREVDRRE